MATSVCSNSRNNIFVCLTGRQQHSSKFSSSKLLITSFVKILHRQTFAPYGIAVIANCFFNPDLLLEARHTPLQ